MSLPLRGKVRKGVLLILHIKNHPHLNLPLEGEDFKALLILMLNTIV